MGIIEHLSLQAATDDSLRYLLVFDIARDGYRYWWFAASGLLPVAVGIAVFVLGPKMRRDREMLLRLFGGLFVFMGFVWSVAAFSTTYGDFTRFRQALRESRYQQIEGVVTNFVPGNDKAHVYESFEVAAHRFSYTPAVLTAGFNRTRERGGIMQSGLHVRIALVDGQIARLEVRGN